VRFTAVIEHGEAALARGTADPLVHYYVGLAQHDIVALSRGAVDPMYSDAGDYTSRAPVAAQAAVAHLRAALIGLDDRALRRHAWRVATYLTLRRNLETRYYCVYD
jgi:hypothetical protein